MLNSIITTTHDVPSNLNWVFVARQACRSVPCWDEKSKELWLDIMEYAMDSMLCCYNRARTWFID